ncbi:hypothetical protein BSKO_11472 [Bryopsis sp. KO-2023]|nr:hypothetical protein BSKO_11472 [Bryopsis sp. KO-2023]
MDVDDTPSQEGTCFLAPPQPSTQHKKPGKEILKSRWFWHPWNLAFDSSLEKTYNAACRVNLVGWDCSVYVLACVPIPMLLMIVWSARADPLYKIAISSMLSILPPMLAYLSCYQAKWYWERRDTIVSLIQIAAGVGMMQWSMDPVEFVAEEGGEPRAIDLATHILTKSPIAASLFCAVCLRLRFRKHLVIQLVMLALCCGWSITFCSSCGGSVLGHQRNTLSNSLGKLIDGIHPVTMFMNLPESSRSCLGVCLFLTTVLGFLAPMALVYYAEISSREKFLEDRVEKSEKISLLQFRRKGVEFLIWFLVVMVQVAWIIFRGFG